MTSETETLIEKVARLAGWERDILQREIWVRYTDMGDVEWLATDDRVYGDGLRILLDELLRAGFAIIGTYRVSQITPFGEGVDPIEVSADTLEEAVMLAYVSMKEAA